MEAKQAWGLWVRGPADLGGRVRGVCGRLDIPSLQLLPLSLGRMDSHNFVCEFSGLFYFVETGNHYLALSGLGWRLTM